MTQCCSGSNLHRGLDPLSFSVCTFQFPLTAQNMHMKWIVNYKLTEAVMLVMVLCPLTWPKAFVPVSLEDSSAGVAPIEITFCKISVQHSFFPLRHPDWLLHPVPLWLTPGPAPYGKLWTEIALCTSSFLQQWWCQDATRNPLGCWMPETFIVCFCPRADDAFMFHLNVFVPLRLWCLQSTHLTPQPLY